MTRRTPTESFQPTVQNAKRLGKLKEVRGLTTKTINAALDAHFTKQDKTLAELTLKVLTDLDNGESVSRGVFLRLKTMCEEVVK